MKAKHTLCVATLAFSLLALSSTHAVPPKSANQDLAPLFLEAPAALMSQARAARAHTSRSQVVQLNPRLLAPGRGTLQRPGTRLAVNLFDGRSETLVVHQVEVKGPAEFVSISH